MRGEVGRTRQTKMWEGRESGCCPVQLLLPFSLWLQKVQREMFPAVAIIYYAQSSRGREVGFSGGVLVIKAGT